MMLCVHHFLLLMWKNLILRRRHYIVTAFELLLAPLLSLLIQLLSGYNYVDHTPAMVHRMVEERDILGYAFPQYYREDFKIAYAPQNTFTDSVMQSVENLANSSAASPVDFIGVNTTDDILAMYMNYSGSGYYTNMIGVVFDHPFPEEAKFEKRVTYRIMLYPDFEMRTDELYYNWGGSPQTDYLYRKFSGIQIAVDKGITQTLCSGNCPQQSLPKINAQSMPTPAYTQNFGAQYRMQIAIPMVLCLSYIFLCPTIIKGVVNEKETGIKELMKMMGMSEFMSWFSWMINAMMVLTFSITLTVILLSIDYNGKSPGGALRMTDPSMFWVFLMMYGIASVAFCFCIGAIMKKPTLATAVGFILWLVTFFGPWTYSQAAYNDMSLSIKLALSLLPNGALALGMHEMSIYAGKELPLSWYNIDTPSSEVDGLSVSLVFLMLFIDIVLYLVITWYVSSVMPGDYGVAQPWYFIFLPTYWCPKRQKMKRVAVDTSSESQNDESSFEREPSDLPVGISIRDIHKVFTPLTGQSKTAVDGVSLNIYEGQITALLGHNGAGKTTLMSILTGLYSPTSGTAEISGYDIRTNMQKVQRYLSLCPQHNMLFNELTVMQHLQVFGMLKGLQRSEAIREGKELIEKLGITDKSDNLSSTLSGGQKRKLSLAIALIGDSKVVMLDEPTSGMDPEGRRGVWDMLLNLRGKQTIVITTHFMEEADVLGDRIAIMAHGKVQCYGSPLFLKKHYGTGYLLKMTTQSNCDVKKVTGAVQAIIPESHLKAVMGSEVSYMLPTDKTSDFPSLFETLEANKNNLRIAAFGVSLTTMDEVFVKVGEIADKVMNGVLDEHDSYGSLLETEHSNSSLGLTGPSKSHGFNLLVQQTIALFRKLMLHSLRKWKVLILQAILPILLTLVCLYTSTRPSGSFMPDKLPALALNLDAYRDMGPIFFSSDNKEEAGYSHLYEKMVGRLGQNKTGQNLTAEFLKVANKDYDRYQKEFIVAADFNRTEDETESITAISGVSAIHGIGISVNLVDNVILKKVVGEDYSITTINEPFPENIMMVFENSSGEGAVIAYSIMFAVFLFLGLAILSATFITFPIQETASNSKQLQIMTGVSPILYWLTSLVWDMVVYLITVCIILICFVAVDDRGIFTSGNGLGAVFLLLFAFGWGGTTMSYLASFRAKTVAGGYALITFLHVMLGIGGAMSAWVVHLVGNAAPKHLAVALEWILQFFPAFPACYGLLQFSFAATTANNCSYAATDIIKAVCSNQQLYNSTKEAETFLACCGVCSTDGICHNPINYITWDMDTSNLSFVTGKISYGVGRAIFFMMLDGCIYLGLIFLLESGILKRVWNRIISRQITTEESSLDEDVQHENNRIKDLALGTSTFVVQDLSKNFGNFTAVRNVSFAIEHSECFGLLGVNGAGKTTTFRMLTGDEIPSSGTAYLLGKNVTDARRAYLSDIGYCPQFDAIIDVLTGEEMLELYASLRGIRGGDDRVQEVGRWVRNLGLEEHRSRPCGTYSGGNKRKLSTAIALIGDPKVVFLDEPTSGVDPSARRKLWQVLAQIKSTGQAVILTSHSMEECEALCSRLAIMVNGQFQCLGGTQHIKSKFGKGFTVVVKLKLGSEVANQEGEVSALKRKLESTLTPCVLKDEHQGLLHYHVTSTTMSLSFLFRAMEILKNEVDMVEDYSISETTLEQVFLSFARQQREEKKTEGFFASLKRKCKCSKNEEKPNHDVTYDIRV